MLNRICLVALISCLSVFAQLNAQEDSQEIPNTQKLEIPFTPPEEALAALNLPEGFQATLFAHEPDVHQPIAMTFDAKGRLWVVENYTYSDRKENFNNDLHDRIVIFEDVDNDGKFDSRKIFWDKGNKLTGIELGRGGVWLTAAPEFIFIPDANRDDVPDGPPKVILDGFEDDVIRHNLVNGLRWGPDGWLYSRHGIQAVSHVGKPGSTMSQRTPMNCCIWRYHPERDVFEIVAEGGTNSWGFDFDEHGEMFFINTVIGHLFHVVPGARYNRMYGAHFNPYTWQTIDQTADHFHWGSNEKWYDAKKGVVGDAGTGSDATSKAGGGHAHSGFMIYQGNNWPDEYRGRAFTLNFHGRRINQEILEREGNSFVARHGKDMFQSADPWFRGVELTYGPDGAVYVLDWSDIGECHENDGIHRTSGRIFKIWHGTPRKPTFHGSEENPWEDVQLEEVPDLNELSNYQLMNLIRCRNEWYSRMALRILADRSAEGKELGVKARSSLSVERIFGPRFTTVETLWAYNAVGLVTEDLLLGFSEAKEEHIRVWSVRLMTDAKFVSEKVSDCLQKMAGDESALVRLYVASSINRLDSAAAFNIAEKLVQYETDMRDRVQPKLIWHQIEPFIIGDFDRSMELFAVSKSQMLRRNIARRLACDPDQQNAMLEKLVQKLVASPAPKYSMDILHGIKSAIEGRKQMTAPKSWAILVSASENMDGQSMKLIADISPVFGDGLSMSRLMDLAKNKGADAAARQQAILSLAQFAEPNSLFPVFKNQIRDRLVSEAVAKSFAVCEQNEVAQLILNEYKRLSDKGKRNAIDTLCSRKTWAMKLLGAVANGRIAKDSITAWHARQIQLFGDQELTGKLTEVWGRVRESDKSRIAEMDRLRDLMNKETLLSADLAAGKKHFVKNCATCHALFGEGGNTGPDLTGADRKNLNYLLENIVDPSASVATSYRASVLALEDGRMLAGVVMDNNGQTLKLQTQDELLTLEVDAIDEIKQTELSLMPEKLLDKLTDKEKTDLFGYLMSR